MNPESTPHLKRLPSEPSLVGEPASSRGEALSVPEGPVEWQHLWFALVRRSWTALAIVPSRPGLGALATARRLVDVGQAYGPSRVHLVDASSVDSAGARLAIAEIERHSREGSQCLIAVASPIVKPAAIAIARAAGAALLLVPLGDAEIGVSRETIACIGPELFLGAIATHPRR